MRLFPLLTQSAHRIALEALIHRYASKITGNILDIGSKDRRYDHLFHGSITACDLDANKDKNIEAGDIQNLPYKDNQFDNVVSFEVLEYTENPAQAMNEVIRVTKPGGTILLSVPFLNYYHDDMMRVTENWIKKQLSRPNVSYKLALIGNSYTLIVDILRRKILHTPNRFLRFCYYPALVLLGFGLTFASKRHTDRRLLSGYFLVIKKESV